MRLHHSVQQIEEHVQVLVRMLKELHATEQNIQMDEEMKETIAARIGDALGERTVNKNSVFCQAVVASRPNLSKVQTPPDAIRTGGLTSYLRFKSPVAPSASSVTLLRRVSELDTR